MLRFFDQVWEPVWPRPNCLYDRVQIAPLLDGGGQNPTSSSLPVAIHGSERKACLQGKTGFNATIDETVGGIDGKNEIRAWACKAGK